MARALGHRPTPRRQAARFPGPGRSRSWPLDRVGDAAVQHVRERVSEIFRDRLDFPHRQVALVQLPVDDAALDDVVDQLLEPARRHLLEAPRRALDRVGQRDDARLPRLRLRPAVTEALLAHLRDILLADVHDLASLARILLLLEGALVKVTDHGGAMVLLDDIDDALVELVFERQVHAFLHVGDDDERAHRRRQLVVRIAARAHIFGEILRFHKFTNVVKIRANPAYRGICADDLRCGLREVCHHQRVMVSARRLDGQAPEQRVIEVRRFEPGDIGRQAGHGLHDRQRAAYDHRRQDAAADRRHALPADHLPIHGREHFPLDI